MNRTVMSQCPSKDYCYGWNLAIEDVKSSVINNRSKAEAIGHFVMDKTDMTYDNVVDVCSQDLYY